MSWAWSGPLGLAALSAAMFALLAGALRREAVRARAVTVRVAEARRSGALRRKGEASPE